MALAIRPTLVKIPLLNVEFELTARDKKVMAVAIASLALFGIQFGLSLSITLATTFIITALTYLSEKYIRTEQNDWFNTNFDKKQLAFWTTVLLLRPFIIQVVCWALGIPFPIMAQVELVKQILTRPWIMVPIATVIAPIAEEILFRGFLLERLEDMAHLINRHKICSLSTKAQQIISNIAQGIIFGALHLKRKIKEGYEIPILFLLSLYGYIFGRLKQENRSLISPMVIHSANNASACLHIFITQK